MRSGSLKYVDINANAPKYLSSNNMPRMQLLALNYTNQFSNTSSPHKSIRMSKAFCNNKNRYMRKYLNVLKKVYTLPNLDEHFLSLCLRKRKQT